MRTPSVIPDSSSAFMKSGAPITVVSAKTFHANVLLTREQVSNLVQEATNHVTKGNFEERIRLPKKLGALSSLERRLFVEALSVVSDGVGVMHDRILKVLSIPRTEFNLWVQD